MDIQTDLHLRELRESLLAMRRSLLDEMVASGRAIRRDAALASDRKELAEREALSQIDEIRELHELTGLEAVDAALARIDAGSYGNCCECREPIGLARLQAMPMATRCAACQRQLEEYMHMGKDTAPHGSRQFA